MSTRKENDFYPTTDAPLLVPPLINELKKRVLFLDEFHFNANILEPCMGNKDLSLAIERHTGLKVIGTDINMEDKPDYLDTTDATTNTYWRQISENNDIDFTITNPPFNLAHAILPRAFDYSKVGVAMILRLSFLEPARNRSTWLDDYSQNLRLIMPFNPRPKFRKGEINPDTGRLYGTDSVTTAWMVWIKDQYLHSMTNFPVYVPIHNWQSNYVKPTFNWKLEDKNLPRIDVENY